MILFFDTETTGFWNDKLDLNHPQQCRVVQLGAMLVDDQSPDRREIMRLDVIVHQPYSIPAAASKVHGITTEVCQKFGVNEAPVMDIFFDMVEAADLVVAHNLAFDTKVLRGTARRLSGQPALDPFAGKPSYCTMLGLVPICKIPNKNGYKGYSWPKLVEACQLLLGREPTAAHQAIGDVIDCRDLYFYMQDAKQSDAPERAITSHEMRSDFRADTQAL